MKAGLNKYYPFKVWAATLICGPFLGIILNIVRRPDLFELDYFLGGPWLLALGGAFVSLPAFAIYYLAYQLLRQRLRSELYFKLILCPVSIICVILTIYFLISEAMLQPSNRDGFLLTLSYLFCVLVAGISFKIFRQKDDSKFFSFEKL